MVKKKTKTKMENFSPKIRNKIKNVHSHHSFLLLMLILTWEQSLLWYFSWEWLGREEIEREKHWLLPSTCDLIMVGIEPATLVSLTGRNQRPFSPWAMALTYWEHWLTFQCDNSEAFSIQSIRWSPVKLNARCTWW